MQAVLVNRQPWQLFSCTGILASVRQAIQAEISKQTFANSSFRLKADICI
jgi:hypothetical protein